MTKPSADISGLIVAICTPFTDNDTIDDSAFVRHLSFLRDNGIERILVNGTTGEFFSLTVQEKKKLLVLARKSFPGTLMYNATCDSLAQTRELAVWGQEHGADAITVLPPYYLAHAAPQGIIDYCNSLADVISIPLLLYNFPKHTQNPLTPEMLASIRHFGIKDSSADVTLIPHTPVYLVGSDLTILKTYQAGGHGYITARANCLPQPYVALEQALVKNDTDTIEQRHQEITAIARRLSGPDQIAMIKLELAKKVPGYPAKVRLPLTQINTTDK